MMLRIEDIKFDEHGLVPAIVQDAKTLEVLMLAYMNAESLRRTLAERETWFWSRSRSELWHKGETSGHTQRIVEVRLDCDGDAIVALVEPAGPSCHTGARSCFYRQVEGPSLLNASDEDRGGAGPGAVGDKPHDLGALLRELYTLVEERRARMPEGSYTAYLFREGLDKILKKVGEESAETIIAAKNEDPHALAAEVSDLIYHLMVLLVERGLTLGEIYDELARRRERRAQS